ncbi:MAG: hypothetical protein AB1558_13930 [Thermodesulfobacteriota bacterium]
MLGVEMTVSGAPLKTEVPPRTIIPFGKTERVRYSAQQPYLKPKLLDQLREAMRSRHYSHRTEETYRYDGKGAKDRITMLPESLKQPLRSHLAEAKTSTIHE